MVDEAAERAVAPVREKLDLLEDEVLVWINGLKSDVGDHDERLAALEDPDDDDEDGAP